MHYFSLFHIITQSLCNKEALSSERERSRGGDKFTTDTTAQFRERFVSDTPDEIGKMKKYSKIQLMLLASPSHSAFKKNISFSLRAIQKKLKFSSF